LGRGRYPRLSFCMLRPSHLKLCQQTVVGFQFDRAPFPGRFQPQPNPWVLTVNANACARRRGGSKFVRVLRSGGPALARWRDSPPTNRNMAPGVMAQKHAGIFPIDHQTPWIICDSLIVHRNWNRNWWEAFTRSRAGLVFLKKSSISPGPRVFDTTVPLDSFSTWLPILAAPKRGRSIASIFRTLRNNFSTR